MSEYRNSKGELFWSDDAAQNAVKAIQFAIDKIDDHYDRLDFLVGWNEGDVAEWPEFFDYINPKKEIPNDQG